MKNTEQEKSIEEMSHKIREAVAGTPLETIFAEGSEALLTAAEAAIVAEITEGTEDNPKN